jgi:predicted DNA-binding transcriptional regulator AlpA
VKPQLENVSIDTKGLVIMTGFCRQRLNVIRKDPTLGFPEPLAVGRSLRWLVSDVVDWLRAMKRRNGSPVAHELSKMVSVGLKSTKKTSPPSVSLWYARVHVNRPTLAQVKEANMRVFALGIQPGQHRIGTSVVTVEGMSAMRYRVSGTPSRALELLPPMRRRVTHLGTGLVEPKDRRSGVEAGTTPGVFDSAAPDPMQRGTPSKAAVPHQSEIFEVSMEDLRKRYEAGSSLDALCAQYRMGKSRLSKLLRDAGTTMRPAGRKPRSAT